MSGNSEDKLSQNPFKTLKGFCALKKGNNAPVATKVGAEDSSPPPEDDFEILSREMERLGLPRPQREAEVRKRTPARKGGSNPVPPEHDETSLEYFLHALGELDVSFSDGIPAEEESRTEPRRMRQVRQGKLRPEAHLDLHGLSRGEALEKVRFFLENAVHHGRRTVLLVTGRGKGSEGEPVLRGEVERYLRSEGRSLVVEWDRAPRQYGGEGALILFLKKPK